MASQPKRIMIQCMGSRGDLQPYLPIASCLQERGYDVMMATNSNHVEMCEKNSVKVVPTFCDMDDELTNRPLLKQSMDDGDFQTFIKAMKDLWVDKAESHLTAWTNLVEEFKPDLIISGTLSDAFAIIGERRHGIPVIQASLFYLGENPPRVLMGLPNLPCGCCKRWLHKYMVKQMGQDLFDAYGPVAKKLYGYTFEDFWTHEDSYTLKFNPRFGTMLVGMNPQVAKVLYGELPPGVKFLGQFAVDSKKQLESATKVTAGSRGRASLTGGNAFGNSAVVAACTDFLAAGSKPVYVGYGSMTAKSPEYMVVLLVKSVKHAKVRAIMYQGWAGLSLEVLKKSTSDAALIKYAEENIMFVGNVPHAWLFPQCAAIIHHGGAGTTHTAAKSGTPQIITPIFVDQWDFAWSLNQMGTGFGFDRVGLMTVKPEALGDAMKTVLASPSMQTKSEKWAEQANADPGAQGVVDSMEQFWTNHVATGAYKKYTDERKKAISGK